MSAHLRKATASAVHISGPSKRMHVTGLGIPVPSDIMNVSAFGSRGPKNMIFSAVDALLYLSYKLGAPGSIAAILTAAPGPSVKLWDAVIDQDWETAKDLHEKLMPLWDAIGLDNMPSLCKYAQSLQGLESGFARRPTSAATVDQKEKVKEALINLNLIK